MIPLKKQMFVYLDDIFIVSSNFQKYYDILESVDKRLSESCLTINFFKCQFCFKELKYPEYIVGGVTLRTDPGACEHICPKNRK